jgi:hypothetical protein
VIEPVSRAGWQTQQRRDRKNELLLRGKRLRPCVSTRRSYELQVAWSVDVLVHQSTHMGRLTYDEALTKRVPVSAFRLSSTGSTGSPTTLRKMSR